MSTWEKSLLNNRFIIAAPKCSVKVFPEALTAALKLISANANTVTSKLNTILKNQTVINTATKINSKIKAISISTFDFFTPYTNIPHHKRKSVMGQLINFHFHRVNFGDQLRSIGIARYVLLD